MLMNKKGFAVSVILYSICFLIVTMLFMLLAIVRTRYNVSDKLRKNVIDSVNGEIDVGNLFPSNEKCVITANSEDFTDNLTLSIEVSNGKLYSWDGESYSTSNTVTVNRSGLYTGYFKDSVGGNGTCEVNIESKTKYSYRTCADGGISYGEWYAEESYSSTCEEITKTKAESENLDTYRICNEETSSSCETTPCYRVMTYKRNAVGCNNWSAWSAWQDTFEGSSAIKESKSATTYRIKNS